MRLANQGYIRRSTLVNLVNRDLGPQKYLILLRRCAFILKNQKIGSRACFAGA
jgi:hypothetical protein